MFRRKNMVRHICFWGVLILTLTAEGWMDLICRALY